jgi:hypothetical protein
MCLITIAICICPQCFPEYCRDWKFKERDQQQETILHFKYPDQRQMSLPSHTGNMDTLNKLDTQNPIISIPKELITHSSSPQGVVRG